MTSARTGESYRDEWLTPLHLWQVLNDQFNFRLDAAADYRNTLCDQWYSDGKDGAGSGLENPWSDTTFCNPPYSKMRQFVAKAYNEAKLGNCTAVVLVAARTDTRAWFDYVRHGEVRFIKGRLKFDLPDWVIELIKKENEERRKLSLKERSFDGSAPFPSALVVFPKGMTEPAKTVYWEVKEKK